MGPSRQQAVSAAGTVDTALSEARTESWEVKSEDEASSGEAGAPSHSHNFGTRTPHTARSQISTAAVSSPDEARPASSSALPSASVGGESALSAAEPDADASFDGEHSSQAAQVPTAAPIVQEKLVPTIPSTSGTSAAANEQPPVTVQAAAVPVARANSVVSHTAGATFSFPAQAQASSPVSMQIDEPPASNAVKNTPSAEEQASVRLPRIEGDHAMAPPPEQVPTPAASGNNSGLHVSLAGAAVSVLHGNIQMSNALSQVRPVRPAWAMTGGPITVSPTLSQVAPGPEIQSQAAHSAKSRQYQSASNPLVYNGTSRGMAKPVASRLSPGLGLTRLPNGLEALAGVELGPAVSEMSHPVFPTLSSPNSAPVGALFTHQLARYAFVNPRPNSEVLSASRDPMRQTKGEDHAEGDSRAVRQAGSGVSGRGRSHYPQPGLSGYGHHRPYLVAGGRLSGADANGAPARQRAYSSSADPGAQPQMARIEGFHDPSPRPQIASIVAPVPELGTPEVVQVVHSSPQLGIPDPIAQPQMASIEGWPGPANPQEQQGSQGDAALSCRKDEEPVNPATSVHATVVMDGTMSEGDDTDLSSMRHRGEGEGDLVGQQGSGMNSVLVEAPVAERPAMSEMGEVMATAGIREPTPQLVLSQSASRVIQVYSCGVLMDPLVEAEAEASHEDVPGPEQAAGSFHNGAPIVHPATSVHATVKADGTLSEGEDDMTSQQGDERRNRVSMEFVSGMQHNSTGDKGSFKVSSELGQGSGAGDMQPMHSTSHASNGQPPASGYADAKQPEGHASMVSNIVPVEGIAAGSAFFGPRSPPRVLSTADADHSREATGSGENRDDNTPAMSARVVLEPVHPATSVHATVMMDGTQSEGDTDLSSMRHDVDEARMGMAMEGVEQHGQSSHKDIDSQNPSVAAPALATYTGDAEMQPSSRTNSMSTGSQGGAALKASRGQEARSPPPVVDPGPRDAEIRDIPQPQATRSTAHGRALTGEADEQKEIQSLMASPVNSAIVQPTVMQAAVSGTAASPTQPEGAAGVQPYAAAATLAGSPQLPKARARNGNGNGHRYGDASSEDDEPPQMEGAVANPEGEGGSGTWRTKAKTVQHGQGALMEGDTDHSSPLVKAPRAGSVSSMGSGGAPEGWENGSTGGALSRPNSGNRAPRPAQPAVTVFYQGDASRASPSQENRLPENARGALSGTSNEAVEHANGVDAVVDCGSGSISRAGSEDQAVAMAVSDNEGGSMGGPPHPVQDSPHEARQKPSGNSSEAEHVGGSPTLPQTEATSPPRPAHSQTEPSHAAGNGSTIGSLGSNADADASPGSGNGAEEPECLGPSAAQMAAAATAAAAAMSATAGTLLADGLPPLPRLRAATASNHFSLGSPLAGPAFALQPPPSSVKRHGGGASSSYNWRSGGSDIHVPNNGIIEEGIHLNGYTSNTRNNQKRHYNNNHQNANHFSATSQLPLHQPALTVMAPIGAVAGFDSPRAYSNSARGRSSYNNHHATTNHVEKGIAATTVVKATSRCSGGVAGENGSGPAQSRSRNSYKMSSGCESGADMRRREGKRKRCSSGDALEKPNESSITSSIS